MLENKISEGCSTCYLNIDNKYKGGSNKWLVVLLSEETSIGDHYNLIEYEIKDIFGQKVDFFIPFYRDKVGDKNICIVLFEGYIFVQEPKEGFSEIDFSKVKTSHVRSPLCSNGTFNYVNNNHINGFKKELRKKIKGMIPNLGQTVIPKEGVFKDLEGKVISIDKKKMILTVRFETSSRVVEAPVSIINVDYV